MSSYETLNTPQQEAVLHTEGPLLILAGAGSGKTRVLTHRIAWMIESGINPYNILAITFTNKAADEMRQRVDRIVGMGSEAVWVSTFHSACVRILRRHIDYIGYDNHFAIYDTDDQKTVIKEVCRRLYIDTKLFKEKALMSDISHFKDQLLTPDDVETSAFDHNERKIAAVYREYQSQLRKNNALDFDDLIMKTVELFEKHPQVLDYYQERFRYIMVDEYQDTNFAQFRLVSLLSGKYRNLCVVGDDDQSIYSFRGADVRNILEFENVFPDARVIRLEQNYRSTKNILEAANNVIANNTERKEKRLWTENEEGEKIHFRQFATGFEEAEYVVGEIDHLHRAAGRDYRDFAILYRTNAQSRIFEEKLLMAGIPYKLVGGINFYSRKEIKDLLAYLRTIDNARDDVSVRRILNVPRRGIGDTTQARIQEYAGEMDMSFFDALRVAEEIPAVKRSLSKIDSFVTFIMALRTKAEILTVRELLQDVIDSTGYALELEKENTEESKARLENIDELITKVQVYQDQMKEQGQKATLSGFLEEVALVADIDTVDAESDYILLMTLHSAKGLEFPHVFITGMEDGIFPGGNPLFRSDEDNSLQEERRLMYVGLTRGMKNVTLTCARQRMLRGEVKFHNVSMFVREIPRELVDLGYTVQEKKPDRDKLLQGDNTYSKMKAAFLSKPFMQQEQPRPAVPVKNASALEYSVGDTVRHVKFGVGIVTEIREGGRDYEVTVNFDRFGVKKMFAGFAKLKKI
ncbi:MAG: DNA helicase PcrA [Blautia sp.]|nr:DNA helicase PcrA [Blautia sp.]